MSWGGLTTEIVLIMALAASVYTDVRYGKILNRVTLPCILLGLVVWSLDSGLHGALFSATGIVVGSIGLLIAGGPGWIAPGDAKLMLAVGALKGAGFAGSTLMFTALVGGVMALLVLMRQRLLREWASGVLVAAANRLPVSSTWLNRAGYLPYSIAIAFGAVLAGLYPLF